jgi:hypothetical protein
MSVTLDQLMVAATVLAALAYFVRKFARNGKKGCDSGCGCDVAKRGIVKRP